VEKFRHKQVTPIAEPLQAKLVEWAKEWTAQLADSIPDIPDELGDRAGDIWEPLLAIADLAGPEWAARARESAVLLSASEEEPESTGQKLLRDILRVFCEDKMRTQELVGSLRTLEHAPWVARSSHWGGSGEFDSRTLSNLLKPFGIKPRAIRFSQTQTANGYWRVDFEDAWARYLPGEKPNNVNQINGDVQDVDDVDFVTDGVPF
jgi:hypothetical protein